MQGHIRKRGKRKDGTWRWQARYSDHVRGGTAKVERTFRSKQEAEAWLISEAASRQQGTWVNPREA